MPMADATTTVLIVDDHKMVQVGLKSMVTTEDIEVIGVADNGKSAIEMAQSLQPDVVLTDIRMPDMDGIDVLKQIKAQMPQIHVIMLTTYRSLPYLLRSIAEGADGFLLKDASRDVLISTIRAVVAGDAVVNQVFIMQVLQELQQGADTNRTSTHIVLTNRELNVLQLLVEGLSNQAIAQTLGISPNTVKEYVQNIYIKLDVTNRTAAAVKAIREGLVE